jgi:hypothetical protein
LFIVALTTATGGCDSGPVLRPGWLIVSGMVTYQGKPLPGGEVVWCTEVDSAAIMRGGPIRDDGTFMLDAPIGPAKVAIHTSDMKKIQPARYVEIPAKYADPDKSGLTHDLQPGANEGVKFDL